MTKCSHVSRVKEWGFNENYDFVASLWDCVLCGAESSEPFREKKKPEIDHTKCGGPSKCFGCKAKGLAPLMNTGDANSQKAMSNKKWDGELNAYRQARAEGIQPAATTRAAVEEAYRASEVMGKAYDADTMINTAAISKESVSTLKETGDI